MRTSWARVVVVARREVTARIAVFDLEPAEGGRFPVYQAGAHIDVRVGPDAIVRQYSLCGPRDESGRYRIAVLLAPIFTQRIGPQFFLVDHANS
jgi:vanillate O-demethylase ferredoxin subunit